MAESSLFLLPLADPAATLENVGGKGASLARLSAAGLPVPGGFHVTTSAYRAFIDANDLQPAILAAVEQANPDQPASLEAAEQTICGLFLEGRIPLQAAAEIGTAYAALPGDLPAVAVRSSATAEDLPDLSFAGQQETYLNVRGAEAVIEAVRRCWASLWTARAIGYRCRHGIDQAAVRLAVVVQELVPADAAGVLFTANPLNGRRDQAVINAAWGLGEAVVGGLVTPDTFVISKTSGAVTERQVAAKEVMTVRVDGSTEEQLVPAGQRDQPALSDEQAVELAQLGTQIERLYDMPMDIEWALRDGQFAILQARPITTLAAPETEEAPVPTGWPMPNPKGKYGRGSIIDLLPDPLTPLYRTIGGRIINERTRQMYLDLSGMKEWPADAYIFIHDYIYMSLNYTLPQYVGMIWGGMIHSGKMLSAGERVWREDSHPRYARAVEKWQGKQPFYNLPAAELLQGARELTEEAAYTYTILQSGIIPSATFSEVLFTQLYNRLMKKDGDPTAPTFLLGYDSAPIRAEKALYDLAMWARSYPALAEFLSANSGAQVAEQAQSGAVPAGVPGEVWTEWQRRFQEYLGEHGHAIYDLDFAKPVAADTPGLVLDTLRLHLRGELRSPYERVEAIAARRELATQAVLQRSGGLKRKLFLKYLRDAQKKAPLREDGLADLGLGYPVLRGLLRELGRRAAVAGAIGQADDIFWLTESEAAAYAQALDAGDALASRVDAVTERKALWRAEKRVTPPTMLPPGSKIMGINVEKMGAMTSGQEGSTLKGVAASPGRITAAARVLRGPEDFDQMQPGEVLVAAITTPAWTPLFARAAAVVTDVGGPLSHGSIVAREYGIPAVLGTGVATRRIISGQRITVDGSAGVVILLDN